MPRLNESTDAFEGLVKLIEIKKTIHDALAKPVLFNRDRTKVVREQLIALGELLQNNKELCDLANAAFGAGSAFNSWVNEQPADKKENYRVRYNPQVNAMQVGSLKIEHLAQDQMSFESTRYATASQSEWLDIQETNPNPLQVDVSRQVENFILSERLCVTNALASTVLLDDLLRAPEINSNEKNTINKYLELVRSLQLSYTFLNLDSILEPANQSLSKTIHTLSNEYQEPFYIAYQRVLEDLRLAGQDIVLLSKKHPLLSPHLERYITPLLGRTNAYPELLSELGLAMSQNSMDSSSVMNARAVAIERVAELDATVAAYTGLSGFAASSAQRQEAALKMLINSEASILSNRYPNDPDNSQIKIYRSTYLKILLTEAFPEIFGENAYNIIEEEESENISVLGQALGVEENQDTIAPEAFNIAALDKLYKQDRNPVWLLLQIIKPVDGEFSLIRKIMVYETIIQLTKEGILKFSNDAPLDQARLLAQNLLNLVKQKISDNPRAQTPGILRVMKTINDSIESSILTKAYKKAAQSMKGEDPSKLDLGEQTTQRQYREFIEKGEHAIMHASSRNTQDGNERPAAPQTTYNHVAAEMKERRRMSDSDSDDSSEDSDDVGNDFK